MAEHRGRQRWWPAVMSAALALAVAAPASAQAGVGVSDTFARVAKEVGKRIAVEQLMRGCPKKCEDAAGHALCRSLVANVADAFEMSLQGSFDKEALGELVLQVATEVAEASVLWQAQDFIAEAAGLSLQPLALDLDIDTQALGAATARCLLDIAVHAPRGGTPAGCQPLAAQAAKIAKEKFGGGGGPSASPALKAGLEALAKAAKAGDVPGFFAALHATVKGIDPARGGEARYLALVTLTQLQKILREGAPGSLFDLVERAAARYDDIVDKADNFRRHGIFRPFFVERYLDLDAAGCANADASKAYIAEWNARRAAVFAGLSSALARGAAPDPTLLDAIPVDLPDPQCSDPKSKFAQKTLQLRNFAAGYRGDVKIAVQLMTAMLPTMAAAAFIDFLRTKDAEALSRSMTSVGLRALARALAAHEARGLSCQASEEKDSRDFVCQRVDDGDEAVVTVPKEVAGKWRESFVLDLVGDRYSLASARRTCVYQAVASAFGRPVETVGRVAGFCRIDKAQREVLRAAWGVDLQPIENTGGWIARWPDARVAPLSTRYSRLMVAGDDALAKGWALLHDWTAHRLPRRKSQAIVAELQATLASVSALGARYLQNNAKRAEVDYRAFAAAALSGPVHAFLNDRVKPLAQCQGEDARELDCALRLLLEALYAPAMEAVTLASDSAGGHKRLAKQAYAALIELNPLSASPLLFNIGLGYNVIPGVRDDENDVHSLVLLDKIGVALKRGDRNQFELGAFVGGFMDALVREATGDDDPKLWLAGVALGMTQVHQSVPLGVEAHIGAALPFDLSNAKDQAGLAIGLSLILPPELVMAALQDEEE